METLCLHCRLDGCDISGSHERQMKMLRLDGGDDDFYFVFLQGIKKSITTIV